MNILVINCGSSSLKYRLLDLRERSIAAAGHIERIGEGTARLVHRWPDASGALQESVRALDSSGHAGALAAVAELMSETAVDGSSGAIDAIGHRVVHGGERFTTPVRIDARVIEAIRELVSLAPLHNGANLLGIELCLRAFPGVPQVAVFDTAFHQSMPAEAYRYALPEATYTVHGARRYGFHGSSHAFVARRAAEYLGASREALDLITLHLGNGASATAIRGGRSIDTSMGMTPLEGLVMGTRSGDIDPSLIFHLARGMHCEPAAIEEMLNRESGLRGLCGSNDMREVLARVAVGDARADLALAVYCRRVKKYVGAYFAVLGRLDALVFTAGIGENCPAVRARVCAGLEGLGIVLDPQRNENARGDVSELQVEGAAVRVLVVRTDEELEIAEQTCALLASEPS